MTEEEMAKEYAEGLCKTCTLDTCRYNILKTCAIKESLKEAYFAGLEAGKPQWHDLRKDPNDLPEHYMDVVNQDGEKVMYDYSCKAWRYNDADEYFCDTPIAWYEIPQFKDKE